MSISTNVNNELLLSAVNNRLISDYVDNDDEEEDDDDEDLLMGQMKSFQINEKTCSSSSSSSSSSFTSASSLSPKNEPNLMPSHLNANNPSFNVNNYIRYTYFNDRQENKNDNNKSLLVDIEYLSFNESNKTNETNVAHETDQRLSIDSSASNTSTSSSTSTTLSSVSSNNKLELDKLTAITTSLLVTPTSTSPLDNKFLPISISDENMNEIIDEDEDLIQSSIKQEEFDLTNQRIEHLFTPDSLESVSSSSSTASLSDDLDEPISPILASEHQQQQQQQQQQQPETKSNETIDIEQEQADDEYVNSSFLNSSSILLNTHNTSNNRLEQESEIEDVEIVEINTNNSIRSEYLEQKEFELNEKQILAEEAAVEQLDEDEEDNQTSDTSLILEKIRKINKLQEKINDINNKIKTIDMTSDTNVQEAVSTSTSTTLNSSYYCLNQAIDNDQEDKTIPPLVLNEPENDGIRYYINPNYCDEDEEEDETNEERKNITQNNTGFFESNQDYYNRNFDEDDEEDVERLNYLQSQLLKSANESSFRSLNNQTRLGIRRTQHDDEYEENEEEDNRDFEDEDEDDDDDEDIGDFYRHAQPVALGKKFASTGFLFHRFGGYLAPIEENDAEDLLSSSSSSNSSSISSLSQQTNQPTESMSNFNQNISIKGSTSCFNLSDNSKSKISASTLLERSINSNNNNNKTINNNSINEEDIISMSSSSPTNLKQLNFKDDDDSELIQHQSEPSKQQDEKDENSSNNVPEDNVERLRNIRDMFENSNNDADDQVILQRVEKAPPSAKLLERLSNNENNLHEFEFDNLLLQEINSANNNNTATDHSDDSSSANEKEYQEEEEEDLEENISTEIKDCQESDNYFIKLSPQITLNSQSILNKMDILQEERSINGDYLSMITNNLTENNNINLLNGFNSSKTTSSVSSSTSISSNVESATGINEETFTPSNNFENDSQDPVIMHVPSAEDSSAVLIQNDYFELDANENRFLEATNEHEEAEHVNPGDLQQSTSFRYKQKDIITIGDIRSVDMRRVKTRFENFRDDEDDEDSHKPRPIRLITPPPEGANIGEIENQPMERRSGVVSAYDKLESVTVQSGYIRSRKEMFKPETNEGNSKPRGIKEITPPREDILKRVLKETTPERNENVVHASDRTTDVLPKRGNAKQKAAVFANSNDNSLMKSIERSGIKIEGELTEKGLAKSRAAIFSDPNTYSHATMSTTEIEAEYFKQNVSGVAKERLNIFKNLEQQQNNPSIRTSPSREFRKLKEFTPPPQLDPLVQQQRQYIIIDRNDPGIDLSKDYNKDEFFVESGLAKNRIKQYLETNSQSQSTHIDHGTGELSEKGLAKSLLAKWKSMENVKDKETSPEPVTVGRIRDRFNPEEMYTRQRSPSGVDNEEKENLIQAGNAKNLLSKWNNIDSNGNERRERRGPRQITPPPPEELRRNSMNDQDAAEAISRKSKPSYRDEEISGLIGKGNARNALARLEQSFVESSTKIRRTVTPPKEFINKVLSSESNYIYESTPVESGINSQFGEHEDVIPSAGHAKNLKTRFLNLEKEAAKVETSSSKMNYIPKKFTSSSPAAVTAAQATNDQTNGSVKKTSVKKISADKIAAVTAPTTPQINPNKELNTNIYLSHHASTLSADKCCVCEKTVYAMEKIEADKKVYHKLCFKCTSCNCTLNEDSFDFVDGMPYCAVHIKQFLSPTKSPKKAVVYDTVNNVIQVKEFDELKIDTSFKSIDLKQGVKSPNQQFSPTKQVSQQNSPAFKQASQPNSPAVKQPSQQNSPVPRQQASQPSSPVKQMTSKQQFSPSPKSPAH